MLQHILILVSPIPRIDYLTDNVSAAPGTSGGLIGDLAQKALFSFMKPRAIDDHNLRGVVRVNAVDLAPRGLRAAGNNGHLGSKNSIQQTRLPYIRPPNK